MHLRALRTSLIVFFYALTQIYKTEQNFTISQDLLLKINKLYQYRADASTISLERTAQIPHRQQSFQQTMDKIKRLHLNIGKTQPKPSHIVDNIASNLDEIATEVVAEFGKIEQGMHTVEEFLSQLKPFNQTQDSGEDDASVDNTSPTWISTPLSHSGIKISTKSTSQPVTASKTTSTRSPTIAQDVKFPLIARIVEAYGIKLILFALQLDVSTTKVKVAKMLLWKKQISSKCIAVDKKLVNDNYDNPEAVVKYIRSLATSTSFQKTTEDVLNGLNDCEEKARYFEMEAATIQAATTSSSGNDNRALNNILYIAKTARRHSSYLLKRLLTIVDYLNTEYLICIGLVDSLDLQVHVMENTFQVLNKIIAANVSRRNYDVGSERIKGMADDIRWRRKEMSVLDEDDLISANFVANLKRLAGGFDRRLLIANGERNALIASARLALARISGLFERLEKMKCKMYVQNIVSKMGDLQFASSCDLQIVLHEVEDRIENIITNLIRSKCEIFQIFPSRGGIINHTVEIITDRWRE